VATPTSGFEEAVSGADVVIVATNHSAYSTPEALRTLAEVAPECLLVDPWNALGTAQVFAYVAEVAALRA
jgi:UDP-N-acetyl-D-mannosaminuronic acid dehydrogenase